MKKNKFIWFIILGAILIGALWVGSWLLIDYNIENSTNRGEFGDKFGAINSLFSGLAFLGLIITLLFQKEELELQRQELSETRKELEGQKKEFEEQNKTIKYQRFENTLFHMISLHQEIIRNLSYIENNRIINNPIKIKDNIKCSGHGIFKALYKGLTIYMDSEFHTGLKSIILKTSYNVFDNIKDLNCLDHYYILLYRIFRYIDESNLIDNSEKYYYSCIVRSQLSDYELVLLFYHCISTKGKDKFKPLIEKYALLNNLREDLLALPEHKDFYNKSAFDRNFWQGN